MAAPPLPAMVGRWPSLTNSARTRSALISLSSATRIERPPLGGHDARRFDRLGGGGVVEGIVGGKARGKRNRAHRLDQIAGEARLLERSELVAHGRRDQHDPPRNFRRRCAPRPRWPGCRARDRPARRSTAAPASSAAATASSGTIVVRAPQRCRRRASNDASIAAGATMRISLPVRSGTAIGGSSASPARGSGTVTRNVEPWPGTLSMAIAPPMRSTMRLEMVRPRPMPPNLRVEPTSACSNSRKTRA